MRHLEAPASPSALAALPDEEVVERVVAGDAPLFEILMRRHNQRIFRVVRGMVPDDDEAEDVMQEAYVRAYRELASFRGEARFTTWLTRIAIHEALARGRKRHRLVVMDPEGDGASTGPWKPDGAPDPERAAESGELRTALQEALESLPETLRTVFLLREVEGLSTAEAAEALEISPENVKVRLHRSRAALRERLDRRIGREARRLYLFHAPRCDRLVAAVFRRLGLGTG